MSLDQGIVVSVNVGKVRRFEYHGRQAVSGIWKKPVNGRVWVRGVNLQGDDQADRTAHGGPDKVVYAYAVEDALWWESKLDRPIEAGEFGENLTTQGLNVTGAVIGERWKVGSTLLEVSEPRVPCWRLGVRMKDKRFPARFVSSGRPGAYFRLEQEGQLAAGDPILVVQRPGHGVTIGDVFRIYFQDRHEAARLLSVPQLSASWKRWAKRWLSEQTEHTGR